jgi:hypothetical protein
MIEIEFEEPTIKKCDCCGQQIVTLTRFVHKDGDAFAIYYANFTRGHADKVVHGLIGLGEWGDNTKPADRIAFPFDIRTNETNYQVGLINAKETPLADTTFLGKLLDRDEALKHDWIKEVFHITDHMVSDDKIIIEYLNN